MGWLLALRSPSGLPDTLSAVSQHRVKRPWKAKRNEVMTHSAAVVGKMLLDNIAEEIVCYNDAVTVSTPSGADVMMVSHRRLGYDGREMVVQQSTAC